MKTLLVFGSVLTLATVYGCTSSRNQQISPDEYTLYAILIDTLTHGTSIEMALVSDSTLMTEPIPSSFRRGDTIVYHDIPPGSYTPHISGSIVREWPDFDTTSMVPDISLKNRVRYRVVADSIRARIPVRQTDPHSFRNSPYRSSYEKGEVGLFWFSRAAIDSPHAQALVYCEHAFGYLNGGGAWYWLRRVNGHWLVHKTLQKWVS